jgi:hypothetical protein
VLLPALLFLCLLDVPFILWAALWGLVIQAADPNRFSALTSPGLSLPPAAVTEHTASDELSLTESTKAV